MPPIRISAVKRSFVSIGAHYHEQALPPTRRAGPHPERPLRYLFRLEWSNLWAMKNTLLRPLLAALALLLAACSQPDPPTVTLYVAVHRGDVNQVERHIRAGSDLNQQDADGRMPLHVAAADGRAPVAEVLLKGGAKPDAQDRDGVTPMQHALRNGRIPVAKLLRKYGAPLPADELLLDMVKHGVVYREVTTFLIQEGAQIDKAGPGGDTPLLLAIRNKDRVMVKRLIEGGADVSLPGADGTLPLQLAKELDEQEIVRLLERQGAAGGAVE